MVKNRRKFIQCPNCGYTLQAENNYCPNCGQENHDLNVPVKHLIAEFFEGTLHFDTKVWRTLKLLILKPGLLTEKFNIGQRASYVPPFRLYVFVSVIFFFVVALTTKSADIINTADQTQENAQTISSTDTLKSNTPAPASASDTAALNKAAKVLAANKEIEKLKNSAGQDDFNARFAEKVMHFSSKGEEAKQKLLKNLSFMMFLLMPFFAWLLYLFYYKHGRNYVEHLMFSIHLHTFYFILLIVVMLFTELFPNIEIGGIMLLGMVLYLLLALHQVYKRSFWRTLLSLIPIGLAYLVTLFIFFMGTLAVSVLLS